MKDRGSRFQLFFVHKEQLYPRCKLSELINTERLFVSVLACSVIRAAVEKQMTIRR
jgi:hypothetical protein